MSGRGCVNSPNKFCYICGEFVTQKQRKEITETVKKKYYDIFKYPILHQSSSWAPNIICSSCYRSLNRSGQDKTTTFRFKSPMKWMEPQNHDKDCYFCAKKIKGLNRKRKIKFENTSDELPRIKKPVRHDSKGPSSNPDYNSSSELDETSSDEYCGSPGVRLQQTELNDLVRDLNLSKKAAVILGRRLSASNCLHAETKYSFFRNRDVPFRKFFAKDGDLVYCIDIEGLIDMYGIKHIKSEWRLFIDSSRSSLKVVLLHNGNKYASLPIGHSVHMKEEYDNIKFILDKIQYKKYEWKVCGDLKIITMILGQQEGNTKYPCFKCQWDSRDKKNYWKKYPKRSLSTGQRNIKYDKLVEPENIFLPPLHIKLGIMKQFVKSLPKDGETFLHLQTVFPRLSEAKIKAGVFNGPDICKFMKNNEFIGKMTSSEKSAWLSLKSVTPRNPIIFILI